MSEEIDKIFERWEAYLQQQYVPEPPNPEAPIYNPLPLNAGPKAISIEEYRRRQTARKQTTTLSTTELKAKKKRAGKQFQRRKNLAILYRDLNLATTKKKQIEIKTNINLLKQKNQKKNIIA